jgi:hypothetical protein
VSREIYREIEERWAASYSEAHRDPPPRSEFSDVCAEVETRNRRIAASGLQPWLGILEFGVEWLSYVHFALTNANEIGPRRSDYRVPWALIGSASSFGLALRGLCLSGFDTPAKALLRTYTEALFLCLAVLHDKSLGLEYSSAADDAKVKQFWHKTASPRNLHDRLNQIERKVGLPQDLVTEVTSWRRGEYEVLAQSAHLSYLASCMTLLPAVLCAEDSFQVGILGIASDSSIRTVSYAARTTWYFSRLSFDALLARDSSDDSLLVLDKENDLHRRIVIGRDVLSEITLAHWGDGLSNNGSQPTPKEGAAEP